MKSVVNTQNIQSNISGGSEFRMAATAAAFETVTGKLYKDPIRAIVRENITNAIDACKAANVDSNNFEVTLPSNENPIFAVEDFGIGMDDQTVIDVYTVMFSSTKTNTNNETGMFGLGSKTPFNYTSQFIVQSSKNGIKSTYLIFKNEEGLPSYKKLSSENCAQSGTRIQFAVKPEDFNKFYKAAIYTFASLGKMPKIVNKDEFFNYVFREGTYKCTLKGIKECDYETSFEGLISQVNDGDITSPLSTYFDETWYVEMGTVLYSFNPYTVSINASNVCQYVKNIKNKHENMYVLHVGIGSMDIPPSREEVQYTDKTKDTLEKAIYDFYVDNLSKCGRQIIISNEKYFEDVIEKAAKNDAYNNVKAVLDEYEECCSKIKFDRLIFNNTSYISDIKNWHKFELTTFVNNHAFKPIYLTCSNAKVVNIKSDEKISSKLFGKFGNGAKCTAASFNWRHYAFLKKESLTENKTTAVMYTDDDETYEALIKLGLTSGEGWFDTENPWKRDASEVAVKKEKIDKANEPIYNFTNASGEYVSNVSYNEIVAYSVENNAKIFVLPMLGPNAIYAPLSHVLAGNKLTVSKYGKEGYRSNVRSYIKNMESIYSKISEDIVSENFVVVYANAAAFRKNDWASVAEDNIREYFAKKWFNIVSNLKKVDNCNEVPSFVTSMVSYFGEDLFKEKINNKDGTFYKMVKMSNGCNTSAEYNKAVDSLLSNVLYDDFFRGIKYEDKQPLRDEYRRNADSASNVNINEFSQKYSMLNYMSTYSAKDHIDDVIKYVNMVDSFTENM